MSRENDDGRWPSWLVLVLLIATGLLAAWVGIGLRDSF